MTKFLGILPPIAPGKIKGTPAVVSWLTSPGVIFIEATSVLRGCGLMLRTFPPEKYFLKIYLHDVYLRHAENNEKFQRLFWFFYIKRKNSEEFEVFDSFYDVFNYAI